MALPELTYFPLSTIAERWSTKADEILRHAINGLLEVSVLVVGVRVQVGYDEEAVDGFYQVVESEETIIGPQPLLLTDVWRILQYGAVPVEGFKSRVEDGFVSLLPAWSPQRVSLRDVVITRAERDRVEREHGIQVQDAPASRPASGPAVAQAFSYTADFRSVSLGPKTFQLGQRQAAVVRLLFEAAEAGDPWVPAATLLSSAGSRSGRLIDLFKTKENWRDLLIGDGAGRYRLATAERRRAYRRSKRVLPPHPRSRSRDDEFFYKDGVGSKHPTTAVRTASTG